MEAPANYQFVVEVLAHDFRHAAILRAARPRVLLMECQVM